MTQEQYNKLVALKQKTLTEALSIGGGRMDIDINVFDVDPDAEVWQHQKPDINARTHSYYYTNKTFSPVKLYSKPLKK